jgi:hypothetical protein
MKKALIFTLFLISFVITPWACTKNYPLLPPSNPGSNATPTGTPTLNTTPVCGYTLYSLGTVSIQAGPSLIRSQADWLTFWSNGTGQIAFYIPPAPSPTPMPPPAPPVDFSKQMLIMMIAPVCPSSSLQITNVCEGPTQVTVFANNVAACVMCNMSASWGYAAAIAVPQSNLPVVWNTTNIGCTPTYFTPTPTATP